MQCLDTLEGNINGFSFNQALLNGHRLIINMKTKSPILDKRRNDYESKNGHRNKLAVAPYFIREREAGQQGEK